MEEKLVYNVYMEDFNKREIKKFNVFNHYSFYNGLLKCKKKYKNQFNEFSNAVKELLCYYFWAKSEYEIILTSWPPYVENKEIDRLVAEREEHNKKYNKDPIRSLVELTVAEKVDIYNQIMLNWDIFINYIWANLKLIKVKK